MRFYIYESWQRVENQPAFEVTSTRRGDDKTDTAVAFFDCESISLAACMRCLLCKALALKPGIQSFSWKSNFLHKTPAVTGGIYWFSCGERAGANRRMSAGNDTGGCRSGTSDAGERRNPAAGG
jgi:hypothetical protein